MSESSEQVMQTYRHLETLRDEENNLTEDEKQVINEAHSIIQEHEDELQ